MIPTIILSVLLLTPLIIAVYAALVVASDADDIADRYWIQRK